MTNQDFLSRVPGIIVNKTLGQGMLKTACDRDGEYLAWYEYESKVSAMALGNDWGEVYDHITKYLSGQGISQNETPR